MRVLVTGGTGSVGQALVPKLQKKNVEIRVLTRKAQNGGTDPSINLVVGDMLDPSSMLRALEGVDKLFLLNAVAAEEQTQALITLGMAKRAGVKHITYLSVLGAEEFPEVPHFASKIVAESALRETGIPHTILRPAFYYQNDLSLKGAILGGGFYPLPIGSKGISATDVDDIAEIASISLTEGGHEGVTYDVASPELISGPANAELWSRLLNKAVKYGGDDLNRFEEQMRSHMEAWKAYDLQVMFEGFQNRGFVASEAKVEQLTKALGRAPRTYEAFATAAAEHWLSTKG